MSFSGDLQTIGVADLLFWIARREKTGTLHLSRRSIHKRVAFADGVLHSSWSNDPRETLGQALVRDRLVSEEALFQALLRQEQEGGRLGEILIGEGKLSEEQLFRVLRTAAEEQIYDTFLWAEGRFDFRDDEPPPAAHVSLDVDVTGVIEEGSQRHEEWRHLRQRFPTSEITFKVTREGHAVRSPLERQVLGLAAAGKTLAAISFEARRSEFSTTLLLAHLCDKGALVVDQPARGLVDLDPVGAIAALLQAAEQRLAEQRLEAALDGFEQVLALDGVNQRAKKGLLAVSEARHKAKARQKVGLDRVPVLRVGAVDLTREKFDPHEGFLLSRINGEWDVRSILKLCPIPEDDALLIFARLLERKVIELT